MIHDHHNYCDHHDNNDNNNIAIMVIIIGMGAPSPLSLAPSLHSNLSQWLNLVKELNVDYYYNYDNSDDDDGDPDDGDSDGQVDSVSDHREIHLSCPSSPLGAIIMFPFNIIIF